MRNYKNITKNKVKWGGWDTALTDTNKYPLVQCFLFLSFLFLSKETHRHKRELIVSSVQLRRVTEQVWGWPSLTTGSPSWIQIRGTSGTVPSLQGLSKPHQNWIPTAAPSADPAPYCEREMERQRERKYHTKYIHCDTCKSWMSPYFFTL